MGGLAAEALARRTRVQGDPARAQILEAQGKVLVVAPEDTFGVDTLTRDKDSLDKLYQEGYADGKKIAVFLGNL